MYMGMYMYVHIYAYLYVCVCVCVCVYVYEYEYVGGWGDESLCESPTGKSVSVSVRVVRAGGRGEAA